MKKYLIQILVVLVLLGSAWGLFLLGKSEQVPEQAAVEPVKLPISGEVIPIRNWTIQEPEILAESAIVVNYGQRQAVLFEKNSDVVLPIASLSKLMTAIVVLENFSLEEIIEISKESVLTMGDKGSLIRGEELTVKDLLYIMLIESSNDAAMALANDAFDYDSFLELMNLKAQELDMNSTSFLDPIGLNSKNKSTVLDLAELADYSLRFPVLWEILKTPQTTVYSVDNAFVHELINTNTLLDKFSFLLGGKTGYTGDANGCMLTVSNIKGSLGDNYLIIIVLGSDQREVDMENLLVWAKEAHIW